MLAMVALIVSRTKINLLALFPFACEVHKLRRAAQIDSVVVGGVVRKVRDGSAGGELAATTARASTAPEEKSTTNASVVGEIA